MKRSKGLSYLCAEILVGNRLPTGHHLQSLEARRCRHLQPGESRRRASCRALRRPRPRPDRARRYVRSDVRRQVAGHPSWASIATGASREINSRGKPCSAKFCTHCLALLWQIVRDGLSDDFVAVRASPWRWPCEDMKNGLPDG